MTGQSGNGTGGKGSGKEVAASISGLLPPLIGAMEALEIVARHLHPPSLPDLVRHLRPVEEPLSKALETMRRAPWPDRLLPVRERLDVAGALLVECHKAIRLAAADPQGVLQVYRTLGKATTAQEVLYPLGAVLAPLNQFFVEPARRNNTRLLEALSVGGRTKKRVGLHHGGDDPADRGSFALYIPETHEPDRPSPAIVALHGGGGNGRRFLWSWLREARSRGALLISPTSVGDTWSLQDPEIDVTRLLEILAQVAEEWTIDPNALLLTGMSDGGTFTYLAGLEPNTPFTHLAPVAASFHPILLEMIDRRQIIGKPMYLVHGALDWMFPVSMAREAHVAFERSGAQITYREIPDLSHTYPREENSRILDWMLGQS